MDVMELMFDFCTYFVNVPKNEINSESIPPWCNMLFRPTCETYVKVMQVAKATGYTICTRAVQV